MAFKPQQAKPPVKAGGKALAFELLEESSSSSSSSSETPSSSSSSPSPPIAEMGGCNAGCGECGTGGEGGCGKPGDGLYFSDAGSKPLFAGPKAVRMSLAGCCGSGGQQVIWGQSGDLNRTYAIMQHRGFGPEFGLTVSYDNGLVGTSGPLGSGWTMSPASKIEPVAGGFELREGNGTTVPYDDSLAPQPGVYRGLTDLGSEYLEAQFTDVYYVYDSGFGERLSKIFDLSSNCHYFNYDVGTGKLSNIQFASGRVARFAYNGGGMLDRVECPGARTTYFRYDGANRVNEIIGPDLCHSLFDYDANSYLSKAVDPAGYTIYYGHNGGGQVTSVELEGAETTVTYESPSAGQTTVEDGDGHDWILAFNADNALIGETDPSSKDHQNEYNANFEKLSSEDRTGALTLFGYDGDGNVIRRRDARNNTIYWAFDGHHHMLRQRNPDGCFAYWGYDAAGNLEKLRNFRGYPTYMTYNRGKLATVTDALEGVTEYEQNSAGMVETMTDPNENTTEYAYDAADNLIETTDALGGRTLAAYDKDDHKIREQDARGCGFTEYYFYDCRGKLSRLIDRAGYATDYTYDGWGRRVSTTSPSGLLNTAAYDNEGHQTADSNDLGDVIYTSAMSYDTVGWMASQSDPRGNTTLYARDGEGRVIRQRDALGNSIYYAYDPNGNMIREVGPRWTESGTFAPFTTYHEYDSMNRLVLTRDPLLRETTYDYDCNSNQTVVVAPGNEETVRTYDELDRVSTETNPSHFVTFHYYDAASNEILLINPRAYPTYYHSDALNRRDRIEDALDGVQYYVFDAVGNVIRQRNQREFWAYYQFDAMNREIARIDERGEQWLKFHDAMSNLVQSQPPRGGNDSWSYDKLNRLAYSSNGAGDTTSFGYDENSNQTSVRSPRGYYSRMGYDALNRMDRSQNAIGGVTYFYFDAAGNTTLIKNPLGNTTYFGFDQLNRNTVIRDPLAGNVYFNYDIAGNQYGLTDQRVHSTYFFYDESNRLIRSKDPLLNVSYWGYDENSNLDRSVDNKGTLIYFDYDALDRRTSIEYRPQGGPITEHTFGYDPVGNMIVMNDGWGQSTFAFDGGNLMIRQRTPDADAVYYAYDAAGNRTRLQYPEDSPGLTCYYGYDDAQRMEKLLSPYENPCYYAFDQSSNVVSKEFGNEVSAVMGYDEAERVQYIRYADPGDVPLAYFEYAWDAGSRITKIRRYDDNDGSPTDQTSYYEYDLNDRLISERWLTPGGSSNPWSFFYDYDATGNRIKERKTVNGSETESAYYAYNNDNSLDKRQSFPSGVTTYYYYDLNGSLEKMWDTGAGDATYFTYWPNQLIKSVRPPVADGTTWYFAYDGKLNRYEIDRGDDDVRHLLWDGLNCLEERNADGGDLIARYTYGNTPIYGIGSTVEVYLASEDDTFTLVMDHRGSATQLLNSSGEAIAWRQYNAFGEMIFEDGDWPLDLGYQTNWQTIKIGNKWWGLSKARLYDFQAGRFTQRDLVDHTTNWNIYDYTRNSPQIGTDPNGMLIVNVKNAIRPPQNFLLPDLGNLVAGPAWIFFPFIDSAVHWDNAMPLVEGEKIGLQVTRRITPPWFNGDVKEDLSNFRALRGLGGAGEGFKEDRAENLAQDKYSDFHWINEEVIQGAIKKNKEGTVDYNQLYYERKGLKVTAVPKSGYHLSHALKRISSTPAPLVPFFLGSLFPVWEFRTKKTPQLVRARVLGQQITAEPGPSNNIPASIITFDAYGNWISSRME